MTKKCDSVSCLGGSTTRSQEIECRGCRKKFHIKCVNLNGSQWRAVRDLPGVFWLCCKCRSSQNPLGQTIPAYTIDLVLHLLISLSCLISTQIDITRSLCRLLSIVSKTSLLDKSPALGAANNYFDDALMDRKQFDFSKDYGDLVARNPHAKITEDNCTIESSIIVNDSNKRDAGFNSLDNATTSATILPADAVKVDQTNEVNNSQSSNSTTLQQTTASITDTTSHAQLSSYVVNANSVATQISPQIVLSLDTSASKRCGKTTIVPSSSSAIDASADADSASIIDATAKVRNNQLPLLPPRVICKI